MTHKVLQINSSVFGAQGQSSQLIERLIEKLKTQHGDLALNTRDLGTEPVPYFDAEVMQAVGAGEAKLSDELIEEAQAADTIVIAAPMYNFGIPAQLKAWLDHITRAGTTFRYTENGPEGLLKGKKVIVVTTRGGQYKGTAKDHVAPYLDTILGFIGLNEDLTFVFAEGLAMSDKKDTAVAEAQKQIEAIF